jgi:hypothetical protein
MFPVIGGRQIRSIPRLAGCDIRPVAAYAQHLVMNLSIADQASLRLAINRLPWKDAVLYPPPHQYVVLEWCDPDAWDVLDTAIREQPDSFLAFFRGYQRPMRDWEFEGRRYWRTSSTAYGPLTHMLNRCALDSVEPPRRVDDGAEPMPWEGPPWMPNGSPWPEDESPPVTRP